MDHDVRLQTIEEHQRLRDEHIDGKFQAMGEEIAGLDRRFTNQIAGVENKLDMGFDRVFREISKERDRDSEEAKAKKNEPATVRVSLLLGMVPVAVVVGSLILLLINPLQEDLHEHKDSAAHKGMDARTALVEERTRANRERAAEGDKILDDHSQQRHGEQQAHIGRIASEVDGLLKQQLVDAELRGKLLAYHEWLRDDAEAIKEDLQVYIAENDGEVDFLQGQLDQLKPYVGKIEAMETQLDRVDNDGSRATNLRLYELLKAASETRASTPTGE